MKRSEVNEILRRADEFIRSMGFSLPPFAYFSKEDWRAAGDSWRYAREAMLGWDVTDYGHGKFSGVGLALFTLRNGRAGGGEFNKPYAEKLLISEENQLCPNHFHFTKIEDIINRGGGNLLMRLWQSEPDGSLSGASFKIFMDGQVKTASAGETIRLLPGMSITLFPGQYHEFWAEEGTGRVLAGEVSSVNDDVSDNRFFEPQGRYTHIEEDEEPLYPLCNEYGEIE